MSEFLVEYEIRDGMAVLCLAGSMTLNACSDNLWTGLIKELSRALCQAQASLGRGCSPCANPGNSAQRRRMRTSIWSTYSIPWRCYSASSSFHSWPS